MLSCVAYCILLLLLLLLVRLFVFLLLVLVLGDNKPVGQEKAKARPAYWCSLWKKSEEYRFECLERGFDSISGIK